MDRLNVLRVTGRYAGVLIEIIRPSQVASARNEEQCLMRVRPILCRVHFPCERVEGKIKAVAMADGPERLAGPGIVVGDRAVGIQTENFSEEILRATVLRVLRRSVVSQGDIESPIGSEVNVPAVMIRRGMRVYENGNRSDPEAGTIPVARHNVRTVAGPCICLLYTSPSPRDRQKSRMPSSA